MRKIKTLLVFIASGIMSIVHAQNVWMQLSSSSSELGSPKVAIANNDISFVTGNVYKSSLNGIGYFGPYQINSISGSAYLAKINPSGIVWIKEYARPADTAQYSNGYVERGAVSTDDSGNVYVAGVFSGYFQVDSCNVLFAGTYSRDIFIIKLDSLGNTLWWKQFDCNSIPNVNALVFENGQLYLAGAYCGQITFGNDTIGSIVAMDHSFIAKVSASNGEVYEAYDFSGTQMITIENIVIKNQSMWIVGTMSGTATFGNQTVVSHGFSDVLIAKYNLNGNCIWAKAIGGTHNDWGADIDVDASGNAYICGTINWLVNFGPGININAGGYDAAFYAKYDPSGNCVSVQELGNPNEDDNANGIACDMLGNVIVTGTFSSYNGVGMFGTISKYTAGDSYDIFVARYTSSGTCTGVEVYGNTGKDYGYEAQYKPSNNSFVLGGLFTGTVIFDATALTVPGGLTYANYVGEIPNQVSSGITEDEISTSISVYPNPTTEFVNVSWGNPGDIENISLISITGQLVRDIEVKNRTGISVSVAEIPKGIYIVKATSEIGKVITKKILKK